MRLLPAVIGVGLILFALKASGLAFTAEAATAAAAQPATIEPAAKTGDAGNSAAPISEPSADPLAAINKALPIPPQKPDTHAAAMPDDTPSDSDASGVSSAELDVLTSLADRRSALNERQRELDLKANLIAAAEKRVDEKIAQLKALQGQIEALLGQRDKKEAENFDALVKVYSAMKPKDAARVFASLDGNVRLGVAGRMKADTMAGIMAALPSDVAQKLTVELANRYQMGPDIAKAAAAAIDAARPAAPDASASSPTQAANAGRGG